MTKIPIARALISVSDKRGLTPFAAALVDQGVEIVSSGGTATHLDEAGIPVVRVEDATGAPEMLGGRVKTLHPRIHGGVLADLGKQDHRTDLLDNGIEPFQLVVVNLYPFESTVGSGADFAEAIENIDIGGPTLIRAAAKNHTWVAVVVSPDRYDDVIRANATGGTSSGMRSELAREAFYRTAAYDAAIVNWLERDGADRLVLPMTKARDLRYGENPHQPAAVYAPPHGQGWWSRADQIQGKEMSFNNFADADAAWRLAHDLPRNSVAIIKHMNACGAATAETPVEAFLNAWDSDPVAAFGGVIASNTELDGDAAREIAAFFVEIVIAPSFTVEAKAILGQKKNLRILEAPPPSDHDLDIRGIDNGFLVQKRDQVGADRSSWEAKGRSPTGQELADLEMAWIVAAHTKSNAVVLVKDGATVAVGAGDQSRVGAASRALVQAGDRAIGSVCASDAFFPFRDGPDTLAAAGVTAIVEPGGSIRDDEVVASAAEHDIALVFTGERHFRH